MKKKLFSLALILFVCTSVMAEDVIYITTEQFRERIFDYKTSKEWKYKGDNVDRHSRLQQRYLLH